jgi:putative hydrolase of the HAD superfamily
MDRPAAVLFDLDDTLYPERTFVDGGFRAVGRFLAPRLGRSPDSISRRLMRLHDRDGRGRLFDTLIAEQGLPPDDDLVLAALVAYRTHRPRLRPFPGVVEGLERIRSAGIRTGLVSDGLASVQRRKLAALPSIAKMLDVVIMTDELGPGHAKPSPVGFRVACRLLDADPRRAVYVANDPRKDFVGARKAGLRTIQAGRPPDEGGDPAGASRASHDADTAAASFDDVVAHILGRSP